MSNRKLLVALLAIPVVFVLAVPFIWAVLYFDVYNGYGNYKVRGHQEFAANGVSQIKPVTEMNQLFSDCRHFVTYVPDDVPLCNSVAYFGDRYELTPTTTFIADMPLWTMTLEIREIQLPWRGVSSGRR